MLPSVALVGSGNSNTDATSHASASINFVAGRLYIIGLETSRSGAAPTNPTISGASSGTWTGINAVAFNTAAAQRSRLSVKYFFATSSFSETLTFDYGGVTHTGMKYTVVELTDMWPSGAVIQSPTARGDAGTSAPVALAAFQQGRTANAALAFVGADIGGNPFTAGGSFTLLGQASGTAPAESVGALYYQGDEDPAPTFATADWGILALEIAGALGLGSETDTALSITPAKRITLGVAVETDTALPLVTAQIVAVGLASETDSALAVVAKKQATTGLASEADTALGATAQKRAGTGVASETDSALAVTARKRAAVGTASETDTALPLGTQQTIAVGLATESDAGLAVAPSKRATTGQAAETDAGLPIAPAKRRTLGLPSETDAAFGITGAKRGAVGLALETDAALAIVASGGTPDYAGAVLVFGDAVLTIPGTGLATLTIPAALDATLTTPGTALATLEPSS